MGKPSPLASCLLLLSPVLSFQAYAEVYMTDAQATTAIFPGRVFTRHQVTLTADQKAKIEKASGETVRSSSVVAWKAPGGETVVIDQALGKHEFITYAVGIGKDGKVAGIEILEYRESFGQQVRGDAWRQQFVGKSITSPLKLDQDIKNISGATLSSAHLTSGVRKVLHTYDAIHGEL
jgi:Na+-translocating ferredoxin:NAD+ oxidoreductase RnfG subunit